MVTPKIQPYPDLLGIRICNGIQHLCPTVGPVSAAVRRERQWRMFTRRRSVWSGNYLWRNPGNFTWSEQTCSEANSPSIINSPVLSFPTVTIAPSRLKLSLEETCCYPVGNTTSSLKHTHTHTSDGGSRWSWLYDPKLQGKTGPTDAWEDFFPYVSCLFEVRLSAFDLFLVGFCRPPLSADIWLLFQLFHLFFFSQRRHESEAEDEAAKALWLSALGASTSAAGGARKWKRCSDSLDQPGVTLSDAPSAQSLTVSHHWGFSPRRPVSQRSEVFRNVYYQHVQDFQVSQAALFKTSLFSGSNWLILWSNLLYSY